MKRFPMTEDRGKIMLAIARTAIASKLGKALTADESAPWLSEPGATFVTLTIYGELRGCIGSLEPYRPLLQDLQQNALAAAFRDPRFPPLNERELDTVRVEVSHLSPVAPLAFKDEADALAQLRPGVDGVILEYGRNRGTFLPQVWEQLPTSREFFRHLKMKAGLPADFWADGVRLSRYTVAKFKESVPPGAVP
jgi:AmmeMemoRadiSam system protein A